MADQSLNDFLSGIRLTELFTSDAIKTGLPDPFKEFAKSSGNNPVGTKVQWEEVTGNRQLAVSVNQGSPARAVDQQGVVRRFATALGFKEEMIIGQDLLYALKQNIPIISDNARKELVRRAKLFRNRADNYDIALRASVMANAAIYVDSTGNILPTSSGASTAASVNFNQLAANQITKDGSGSTYNIGDWSSTSTKIPLAVRKLRTYSVQQTGYQLTTVWYGQGLVDYLANNTSFQEYLKRNVMFRDRFVDSNEIPDGVLGMKWRPVSDAFFVDQNSTLQPWFPDNYVAFTPDVSDDWYEKFECGTLVPKGLGVVGSDIDAMLDLVEVKYGMFSFAKIDSNANVSQQYGQYLLPTLKVPAAMFRGVCS